MKEIDLGETRDAKDKAIGLSMPLGPSSEEVIYPVFHYAGEKELELPEEGEMTIRFKKTEEVSRIANGKHFYSCDIQVRKILKVKADAKAPTSSGNEAENSLDRLMNEAEEDEDEDEEGDEY
jgi:hypothetical protein